MNWTIERQMKRFSSRMFSAPGIRKRLSKKLIRRGQYKSTALAPTKPGPAAIPLCAQRAKLAPTCEMKA
eukprot:6174150-Pleurochrysis_carterae.AAC.7